MTDDIVSTVRLEGVDQATSEFNKLGAAGAKAMADIAGSAAPANKELEKIGKTVEAAAYRFGSSIRNVGTNASAFMSNVTRMGASVVRFASYMGLGVAAISKLSNANRDGTEETKAAIAVNKLQSQSLVEQQTRTLSNEQAQRDLLKAFGDGKITMAEYAKQYTDLIQRQKDEEAMARQIALIQSREQEERQKQEAAIRKESEARQAFAATVRTFGQDAASAMEGFARAWDSFMTQFNQGPSVIGDIFRALTQLLQQNGGEIIAIFNRIGAAFSTLFKDQTGKGSFGESFMAFLHAAESFITGVFIPALRLISATLQPIADLINMAFGTQLTGGILAAGIALGALSGAFGLLGSTVMVVVNGVRLLWTVVSAFGGIGVFFTPWGIAIAAIIAAVVLLIAYWPQVKTAVQDAITYVSGLLQKWRDDWNASVQQFQAAWDAVVGWWNGLWQGFDQVVTETQGQWNKDWNDSINQWKTLWNDALAWWRGEMTSAQREAAAAAGGFEQNPSDFVGAPGRARGGPIHGRGTSTSDSVPIWGSRGEWVIQAKAVQHYGRQFMSALNSMRLPRDLSSLGDALMPSPKLRFATGGEVPARRDAGRPIILQFPDGQTFKLNAASETADHLGRYATSRRLAGAGRKPSYYGGGR